VVEDLRTTLLTVERDRASRESAIENLTRALDRKETDLERCTVTLTEREALIERLTVELKSSVEECSQRDRTILNLNAQLEIRATQLQDARDRSQSLSQELEATRREVATGFEQLALERQRYETLADQFSALTQRLAESPAAHTGALGKAANS
jgi:chromosome segregation ATPase